MSFWLYSAESFPAKRKKNPAFQDNPELLMYNNFRIGPVVAGEWKELDRRQARQEYQDFSDKRGNRITILDDEFAEAFNARFAETADTDDAGRGLVVLSDKEYNDEAKRSAAEEKCKKLNKDFRLRRIAEFEMQLEQRKVDGKGRAYPTPYEEECYEVTETTRPGSAEAMLAQRNPGQKVAEQLRDAFLDANIAINKRMKEPISEEEAAQINSKIEEDKSDEATTSAVVFSAPSNQTE